MFLELDLSDLSNFIHDINLQSWCVKHDNGVKRFYSSFDSNNELNSKTYIDVNEHKVEICRSSSAEIPLFYSVSNQKLILSDSVYELQENVKQEIDIEVAYEFIYSQFLPKEKTLYKGVFQLLNDQKISFQLVDGKVVQAMEDNFELPMEEMHEYEENAITLKLRDEIVSAHKARLGSSNALFLSGGLDSQVMAVTLSRDLGLGNQLEGLHFYVKGAVQTELEDAKKTAKGLGIGLTAVEVDPFKEVDFDSLIKTNAPYIGAISINQLLLNASLKPKTTVFTGQDTRLHTPSMKKVDERLLSFLYTSPLIGQGVSQVAKLLLNTRNSCIKSYDSRFFRNLAFFAFSRTTEQYLVNRFFHVANLPFQNAQEQRELINNISDELAGLDISNKRTLFNTVVQSQWRRQYLYDINYMQDNASKHNLKLAAPFYDGQLATFSARLPFDLASKITKGRAGHGSNEVTVNKYLLRKAYQGELDDSLIYRDKAVCLTAQMFFNGALKPVLDEFMHNKEFIKDERAKLLHLDAIQSLCASKHAKWQEQDHWLMMVVFNALVVYKNL